MARDRKPTEIKQRFDHLLDAMLTKPPLAGKPKAGYIPSGHVGRNRGKVGCDVCLHKPPHDFGSRLPYWRGGG